MIGFQLTLAQWLLFLAITAEGSGMSSRWGCRASAYVAHGHDPVLLRVAYQGGGVRSRHCRTLNRNGGLADIQFPGAVGLPGVTYTTPRPGGFFRPRLPPMESGFPVDHAQTAYPTCWLGCP